MPETFLDQLAAMPENSTGYFMGGPVVLARDAAEKVMELAKAEISTLEQQAMEAIKRFAHANGRNWKSKLSAFWARGEDVNLTGLRLARNIFGPSGIYKMGF
jgi:hypothetical protein